MSDLEPHSSGVLSLEVYSPISDLEQHLPVLKNHCIGPLTSFLVVVWKKKSSAVQNTWRIETAILADRSGNNEDWSGDRDGVTGTIIESENLVERHGAVMKPLL